MKRWGALIVLYLSFTVGVWPALAENVPPIAFEDAAPVTATWPGVVESTVVNNAMVNLEVTIRLSAVQDTRTGEVFRASDFWQPTPMSVAIPPAGRATLPLAMSPELQPPPGTYAGELTVSVIGRSTVIRKSINVTVEDETRPEPQQAGVIRPAVASWTLNAIRIFPFSRPICMRGLTVGCTVPIVQDGRQVEAPLVVGHLVNARGSGMVVSLSGVEERRGALLTVAFDRRWGYTGEYIGTIDLGGANTGGTNGDDEASLPLTVRVKDTIVWPVAVLWLGIALARQAQRVITVRPQMVGLLRRLNSVSLEFAKLRKSVHGYTVAEDFQKRKEELEGAIASWDRTHYGTPTGAEQEKLAQSVLLPLTTLEEEVSAWGQFRTKLDRLARKLLQEAYPAIQHAQRPTDIDLEEPRFYSAGRQLLRGTRLHVRQIRDYADKIDSLAELAGAWGELDRLAVLVRDAIGELSRPDIDLSDNETQMLEAARHHVNSASRDLWEAHSLEDLRARETENELKAAQELTRRLMDPFVYYAGSELVTELSANTPQTEPAEPKDRALGFPIRILNHLKPMMRTYARIDTYALPRLDVSAQRGPGDATKQTSPNSRVRLVGERAVTLVALGAALLLGLEQYFTTDFGSAADYLGLFASGLVSKVGLEAANALASRLLTDRE